MKQFLSILIPTYNDECVGLVKDLQRQAASIADLSYEIIVADDGSDNRAIVGRNQSINSIDNCRFIRHEQNAGRAAIRNYLVREARYERLLFIDSDMTICREGFIARYLAVPNKAVAYGGYVVKAKSPSLVHNLRYLYEKSCEQAHTAEQRQRAPYQDFHTSNFLCDKEILLSFPFDERFRHYGYEDVLWGKQLAAQGITLLHIDNPVGFETFEDNAAFVSKTEEGLRTLHTFRNQLEGYSHLLTFARQTICLRPLVRLSHRMFGNLLRRNLCGSRPSLLAFKVYKIGYYLSIVE